MNLALPAFVILIGLLPGVCFFYGYFAGRFDKKQAGVAGVEELALYVVFAIPLDALALFVCRRFALELDFATTSRMLSGTLSEAGATTVAEVFKHDVYLTAGIYATILGSGYVLGALARRFVWSMRWDVQIPLLRLRHDWFYLLQGRLKGTPRVVLAWVDVLTEHPDGSRLYRGLVRQFELGATGSLDSLTLTDATRGRGRGGDFQWISVPSSRLVIMGSKIHSINVTYVTIENQQPLGILAKLRRWWRSFIFEEP